MADDAPTRMQARDLGLGVLVVALWGFNFVPIRVALDAVPPFALASVRFALAALPLVLFVQRPAAPWRDVAAYGLLIGVGQFGLLFLAIHRGMPAGLSSLVIQVQVFFTVLFGAIWLGERVRLHQAIGAVVAAAGIALIALPRGATGVSVAGLALVFAAAASWAAGNVVAKRAANRHGADVFAVVVWSSLAAPIPLALLSFGLEGGLGAAQRIPSMGWLPWASVLFMAWGATLFGYAAWNGLLKRYPTALVTPLALLVPVAGLGSGAVFLGERLAPVQLAGAGVVLAGLAVTLFGGARRRPAG